MQKHELKDEVISFAVDLVLEEVRRFAAVKERKLPASLRQRFFEFTDIVSPR